jgi:hypothetical protein
MPEKNPGVHPFRFCREGLADWKSISSLSKKCHFYCNFNLDGILRGAFNRDGKFGSTYPYVCHRASRIGPIPAIIFYDTGQVGRALISLVMMDNFPSPGEKMNSFITTSLLGPMDNEFSVFKDHGHG